MHQVTSPSNHLVRRLLTTLTMCLELISDLIFTETMRQSPFCMATRTKCPSLPIAGALLVHDTLMVRLSACPCYVLQLGQNAFLAPVSQSVAVHIVSGNGKIGRHTRYAPALLLRKGNAPSWKRNVGAPNPSPLNQNVVLWTGNANSSMNRRDMASQSFRSMEVGIIERKSEMQSAERCLNRTNRSKSKYSGSIEAREQR
jgi:hypothetical protein